MPQQAATHSPDGAPVMVVDGKGMVAIHQVRADRSIGTGRVTPNGLKAGDEVAVDDLQRVCPGAPAEAVPWQPMSAGQGKGPQDQGGQGSDAAPIPVAGMPAVSTPATSVPVTKQ